MSRNGPWTLVLLFVFATTSLSVPSAHAQFEETYTVEGMVCASHEYEKECWQGLPNATVSLHRTDGVLPHDDEATADAEGRFVFSEVPEGAYEFTASRAGFDDVTLNVSVPDSRFVTLFLQPQEVEVPVRVEDEDGNGLDAVVSWWNDRSGGSFEIQAGEGTLATMSGYHSLQASASGFTRSNDWMLLDGSAVTLVLSKVPPQDAVLFGTVRDQDGEPVADAVVEVYQWRGYEHYDEPEPMPAEESEESSDGTASSEPARLSIAPAPQGNNRTVTSADGSYRIHVWSGEVNLNVYKDGHARRDAYLEVKEGEQRHDVELLRYPDKTARLEGRIVGMDGEALRFVTVSLWSPEYGIRECSVQEADKKETDAETDEADSIEPYYRYDRDCAITVFDDGTFEGMVTPGYAILEAWHEHWRSCSESRSSDGSFTRTCGPEYLGHAQTLTLPADETTRLTIEMVARPAADSVVSGYVVDVETQKAIPGVRVHFSNEETYGWGSAGTDGDGSYKVQVREGYHRVSVYAEGYLPWQGTVQVPADGEVSLDLFLTPDQESYGYCCYAYDDVAVAEASDGVARPTAEPAPSSGDSMESGASNSPEASGASGAEGEAVQDLGGGLGPYDPEKRAQETGGADNGAPGPGVALLALALVGAALVSLRRRD